jgi:DNA ligase-1
MLLVEVAWTSDVVGRTSSRRAKTDLIAGLLRRADAAEAAMAGVSGAGSQARRRSLLDAVLGVATQVEQDFLRALLSGELSQGALAGLMVDAVAVAADVPVAAVRRASPTSPTWPGPLSAAGTRP